MHFLDEEEIIMMLAQTLWRRLSTYTRWSLNNEKEREKERETFIQKNLHKRKDLSISNPDDLQQEIHPNSTTNLFISNGGLL